MYWKLNGGGQFKTLGNPVVLGEGIGIMSTPQHTQLINKINQDIRLIEKTQAYMDLYNTYFATER